MQILVSSNRILFLCSGNYYRSRFAEILFNARATKLGLPWQADSRGLQLAKGIHNIGPISPLVLAALPEYGLQISLPIRKPVQAMPVDFQSAQRIIALDESEHRSMISESFPEHADHIEYWQIHDLDRSGPDEALAEVQRQVQSLIDRLMDRL